MSNLANIFEPYISSFTESNVGIGYLSRLIALLMVLASRHNYNVLLAFDTIKKSLMNSCGPSTFSIMNASSRRFNST